MTDYPDDDDGFVLRQLAEHGVDMTQPLLIEFAVAVPDEPAAEAVSEALIAAEYDAAAEYDEGEPDEDGNIDPDDEEFGPSWTVYVNVEMVPDHQRIVDIQKDLDRIAGPLGGHADGWGVMLEGDEG